MNQTDFLRDVLVVLTATVIVVPAFRRLGLSPILGYLAAGVIIGPHSFAIVSNPEAVHTLAEFGVVFLLFTIGLELSIDRLRTLARNVFGLGSLQVIVTGALIGAIAWGFGLGLEAAAIIGGGLALSSTAFVLKFLAERGDRATGFGLVAFAILLFQDLAVVPFLILVEMLGASGTSFLDAFGQAILRGAIALLAVIVFGRFLLRPLFRMIAATRSTELFVAATLLVVLGTGWILSLAGLSMALGAFLAGLLLSETEYRHQIEADIRPYRGILLGLFFMTIGMAIDVALIISNLGLVALIVVALLIGKSIIIAGLCRIVGIPAGISVRAGMALAQGGEFGFVLFGAALTLNLIDAELAQILLAVITLTMIATPAMFFFGEQLARHLDKPAGARAPGQEVPPENLSNHVLIAGFGRVGQTVAKVLSDAGIPYVALDLDQERVAKCRAGGMPVYYGDAHKIHVLEAAGAGSARTAVITLDKEKWASQAVTALRSHYPELPIYVRARDRKHTKRLEKAGATAMVSEAAEASLQLGSIVLGSLDVSTDDITSVLQQYRENDYARLDGIVGRGKSSKRAG